MRVLLVSRAKIVLTAESKEKAKRIHLALLPDNKPLPQGLAVKSEQKGMEIVFEIECARPLSSLLATIDDILKMAQLSEKITDMLGKG